MQDYKSYQDPVVPGAPTQENIRDANDNKAMAIIAYIIFFIPLLIGAHKESPFVKFHTNQGTVLFIASLGYSIARWILGLVLYRIPYIGSLIMGLLNLASILFFVLCIIGIVNVVNGRCKELPIIGSFKVIS
ncbi:MAG: hypothetical protein LBR77_07220 [Lachnospiraceae bacterium]|jgi:uncharacterized membrane protein|nr:hypothetical protein [Lachnospiraceae bacterium]